MLTAAFILAACLTAPEDTVLPFPATLTTFTPHTETPVFTGAGPGHWDEKIRERGWILFEDGEYRMWYTGYTGDGPKKLGYATSPDGLNWTRYPGNPIHDTSWVEDMTVIKQDNTYYMFAEGEHDHAHMLTSEDRVHWTEHGTLDVRKKNGEPIAPGPFGTPAVFLENGTWHLLYERNDEAVWLATSNDLKVWTNVQDESVINCGPEPYDRVMIAVNQVVKYDGVYYAYYHATADKRGTRVWTMNVAASKDLTHWNKYAGNPIVPADHSSGILVQGADGAFRFYCMHAAVSVFFSRNG